MQVETLIHTTILYAMTTVALILSSLQLIILLKKSENRVYEVKQFHKFERVESRVWILSIMCNF